MHSLSFCLSGKDILSSSCLKIGLFLSFSTLNISLLACELSAEKSTGNLIGVPIYVMSHFSLAAFKSLCL